MPELWDHQRRALDFLKGKPGAMLHVAMGGGKTRIAIEHMQRLGARRILVVAPLAVCQVWRAEVPKWWPDHPRIVDIHTGSVADRAKRLIGLKEGLVIGNYDSVWRTQLGEAILRTRWDLVVWDESQRLKTPSSAVSKFAAKVRRVAASSLLLTGTPMPHGPLDIWAQMRAAAPDTLPSAYTAFRARYAVTGRMGPWHVVGYRNLDDLAARVAPVVFRVEPDELDRPDQMVIDVPVELEPEARKLYWQLQTSMVAKLSEQDVISTDSVLTLILRLQQLTGGWLRDDEGKLWAVSSAKKAALAEILDELGPSEPLVVFCQFHKDLDAVHDVAREAGVGSAELSGRRKELEVWQQPHGPQVLAVQTQAGGLGVSMVRAAYAVFYSLTYSYGDYEQALARLVRPGQTRPVTFYRLICPGTIDERIARVVAAKENVIEVVTREIQQAAPQVMR